MSFVVKYTIGRGRAPIPRFWGSETLNLTLVLNKINQAYFTVLNAIITLKVEEKTVQLEYYM